MKIILILHNVRSAHNVGSLLRTADGLGVDKVYLTGYSPFPAAKDDHRLPHLAAKTDRAIAKTALGAEKTVKWEHSEELEPVISKLKAQGYQIAALEQNIDSIKLNDYKPAQKIALIAGSEVGGLPKEILDKADIVLEIPMRGNKESFNVAVAAAMALYHLVFGA